MRFLPIPFDCILTVESFQPFFLSFMTGFQKQNIVSFCIEVERFKYLTKPEMIIKAARQISSLYFKDLSILPILSSIIPNSIENHIKWIQKQIENDVINVNLFSYLQKWCYEYLQSNYYTAFLKSLEYTELLVYLKNSDVNLNTFINNPKVVCAFSQMDMESIPLLLLELNRIRFENGDYVTKYYLLSSLFHYYSSIGPIANHHLMITLQGIILSFPYPIQFSYPKERETLQLTYPLPSFPSYTLQQQSILKEWFDNTNRMIQDMLISCSQQLSAFFHDINLSQARIAVNCAVEILHDSFYLHHSDLSTSLSSSSLISPLKIVTLMNTVDYQEKKKNQLSPQSFSLTHYQDHCFISDLECTSPISGCFFFILPSPYQSSSLSNLAFSYETEPIFSYQQYSFQSRLFPATLKKQSIQPFSFETLTHLCLPLSPHFSLLHSSQDDSSFISHLHEPEVNCKVFCYSSSILLCILSIHHTIQYQKSNLQNSRFSSSHLQSFNNSTLTIQQPLFFFSFLPYKSQSLSLADIECQLIERLKASEPLWLVLNKSYEQKPYQKKRENDIVTLLEEQLNSLLKQWYEQTSQPSSFQIPPVHFRKSVKMPSKQPKDYSIQLTEEITATVAIQEKKIPNFLPISNHIFNISYLQASHPSLCHSLFYLLFTQHSILLLSHDLSLLSSLSNFLIETCHSLPIQYSFIFYSTEHQYLHDTSFHYFLHSSPTNLITCMEVSFQPPEELWSIPDMVIIDLDGDGMTENGTIWEMPKFLPITTPIQFEEESQFKESLNQIEEQWIERTFQYIHLFFIHDQIMFVVNDREVKLLSEKEQPLFLQFVKGDVYLYKLSQYITSVMHIV